MIEGSKEMGLYICLHLWCFSSRETARGHQSHVLFFFAFLFFMFSLFPLINPSSICPGRRGPVKKNEDTTRVPCIKLWKIVGESYVSGTMMDFNDCRVVIFIVFWGGVLLFLLSCAHDCVKNYAVCLPTNNISVTLAVVGLGYLQCL